MNYYNSFFLLISLLIFHTTIKAEEDDKISHLPKVEVHGFVRMDALAMDRIPPNDPIYPLPFQIPLDLNKQRHHNQTLFDARMSRIWLDAKYDLCCFKIIGGIEGDFYTQDGSATLANGRYFRLRHAWVRASCRNWFCLVGQWWSLMTATDIAWPFPTLICDFQGPVGMTYAREPQIRVGYNYELPYGKGNLIFSLSAEKQAVFRNVADPILIESEQGEGLNYPLLIGKAEWKKWQPFQMEAAFLLSQNQFILSNLKTSKQTAWGYKITMQFQISKPIIFGSFVSLNGLNRFALLSYVDAVVDRNFALRNTHSRGGFVGITLPLTECAFLTAIGGILKAKEIHNTLFTGNTLQKYTSYQICLSYKFWENFVMGTEYKHFDVKSFNGRKGSLNYIASTLWYLF